MNETSPETYFVDGGTLRANTPSYVKRPADDELFEALLNREYCYILTPRQMGKSSLMIRTSQRLKDRNIQSAVVDIQGIGTNRIREWYTSLFSRIQRSLKLSVDADEWMTKKSNVGFGQMFSDFIQDVVLTEIAEPVVIFLDEVDWMIKVDFRDDFFASIRSMYNARAQYPEFNRVSFVLLGVASPADLISEPSRTPFNIGHAISLQELSLEDSTPLQNGLEQACRGEGKRILDRIFYWTNGHPYLTQKICKTIAEMGKAEWPNANIDDLVNRLFLAEESRKEANLKFIQDRILSNEQFAQMLELYKQVRRSKIKEKGQSVTQNQLMLSGLVTSRNGYLEVRNRIYQTVFNDRWINSNTPKNWQRAALVVMSSIVIILLGVLGYNYTVSLRLKTLQTDYIRGNPDEKMTALASIYSLRYLFSTNTDIDATAAQAFYEFTPDSKTQLSLFPPYGENDPVKQQHMVIVIGKLYVTLANIDEENNNTSLLHAMDNALHHSALRNETGKTLQQEIDNWLIGREGYRDKDYVAALQGYSDAISANPVNQATLYERAKVYIALGQYESALKDLDTAIGAAKRTAPDIPPTPTNSPIPPTETPMLTANQNNTPQVSETPSTGNTPNLRVTPTSIQPTQTPVTIPIQPIITTPEKFESNFTTLNHVIVAVKALVDKTPELQHVLQSPTTAYSNLDSVGLIKAYLGTATSLTSVADFSGIWINQDPNTGSITRIEIKQIANQLKIHMWGSCTPTDCDWGTVDVDVSDATDGELNVTWDQGFAIRDQKISYQKSGSLIVTTHTHYTDNSGRSDRDDESAFSRASSSTPVLTGLTSDLSVTDTGIVITPSPATSLPPSFGSPQLTTDQIYFGGSNCGSDSVTISIQAEHPDGIVAVIFFYRLREVGGSQDSGWSSGIAMQVGGGGTYSLTVSGDTLVAGTGFITQAQVSYQFVIQPQSGNNVNSTVYTDLNLLPCNVIPSISTPRPITGPGQSLSVDIVTEKDGRYIQVTGGPENYNDRYGPLADGELILGPNNVFCVYVDVLGNVYIVKYGTSLILLERINEQLAALRQGATPIYDLRLDTDENGTYTLYIYEQTHGDNYAIKLPRAYTIK
jgi:tetratricopeptide (TPR) repeat protein